MSYTERLKDDILAALRAEIKAVREEGGGSSSSSSGGDTSGLEARLDKQADEIHRLKIDLAVAKRDITTLKNTLKSAPAAVKK